MASRQDLTALTPSGRAQFLKAAGEPAYRAEQLERWLYKCNADIAEMSNFPKPLRAALGKSFYIPKLELTEEARADDDTTKYLFKTPDGLFVEAVFIPGPDHDTVCLSSQAGCPLKCRFCATASLGYRRSLTAYEISAQFAHLQRARAERIRNAVFMGQGEPLLNMKAVWEAIGILREHFDIGARRITVSTAGLPAAIRAWAERGPRNKLAVSLNSAVQETRDRLMPGVAREPLTELSEACKYYCAKTGRRITFEYVLVGGVNDDRRHARALVAFTRTIPSKINIIPFNRWPHAPFEPPSVNKLEAFLDETMRGPSAVTLRRARGYVISAACGTLAARKMKVTK